MPRAKKGQQKVMFWKKTRVLCMSILLVYAEQAGHYRSFTEDATGQYKMVQGSSSPAGTNNNCIDL